ncbi:hypothetical protein ABKN59_005932 [Abortiporus biennis]
MLRSVSSLKLRPFHYNPFRLGYGTARCGFSQSCSRQSINTSKPDDVVTPHTSNFTNSTNTDPQPPPFNTSGSFRITQPPNPSWKLGDGLLVDNELGRIWKEDEHKGWKTWITEEHKPRDRDIYKLLTSAVTPRPIAYVSTLSEDGVPNLAPMSYFSLVADEPPLLSISLLLSPRKPKDTRENIQATKEFTVNIISEPFIEAANACAIEAPSDVDEWIVSGLTPLQSHHVKAPCVKESAFSMECELYELKDITPPGATNPTTTLILVDPGKLRPVARLGGSTFARLGEGFNLSRPSWKALKESIRQVQPEPIQDSSKL